MREAWKKIGMLVCQVQAVLGAEQGSEVERGMVERHIVGMTQE